MTTHRKGTGEQTWHVNNHPDGNGELLSKEACQRHVEVDVISGCYVRLQLQIMAVKLSVIGMFLSTYGGQHHV